MIGFGKHLIYHMEPLEFRFSSESNEVQVQVLASSTAVVRIAYSKTHKSFKKEEIQFDEEERGRQYILNFKEASKYWFFFFSNGRVDVFRKVEGNQVFLLKRLYHKFKCWAVEGIGQNHSIFNCSRNVQRVDDFVYFVTSRSNLVRVDTNSEPLKENLCYDESQKYCIQDFNISADHSMSTLYSDGVVMSRERRLQLPTSIIWICFVEFSSFMLVAGWEAKPTAAWGEKLEPRAHLYLLLKTRLALVHKDSFIVEGAYNPICMMSTINFHRANLVLCVHHKEYVELVGAEKNNKLVSIFSKKRVTFSSSAIYGLMNAFGEDGWMIGGGMMIKLPLRTV